MTTLHMHPATDDEQTADAILKEARGYLLAIHMLYAPALTHTTEGRTHLRLVEEACRNTFEWAQAHCEPASCIRTVHSRSYSPRPAASTNGARPNNRKGEKECA